MGWVKMVQWLLYKPVHSHTVEYGGVSAHLEQKAGLPGRSALVKTLSMVMLGQDMTFPGRT
jgi:hypothetical protein